MRGMGTDHVISGPIRGIRWCRQTNRHAEADRHGNSMTESAKWANKVKTKPSNQDGNIRLRQIIIFKCKTVSELIYALLLQLQ